MQINVLYAVKYYWADMRWYWNDTVDGGDMSWTEIAGIIYGDVEIFMLKCVQMILDARRYLFWYDTGMIYCEVL